MPQNNLDALYAQIDSLPSLPAIVSDVLEVTGDPESSANDLMRAILPDQSMCVAILKIANSAFFGLPREVSTLEKAVMVLGFDEIKNIVLAKAVFNSFKGMTANNKQIVEQFWSHSFTCGLAGKILAEQSDQSPSEGFIVGLLHDIGKLAMLITFPNIYSPLLQNNEPGGRKNLRRERELFFISHDEVARKILNRWLFPDRLIKAISGHHDPEGAEDMALLAATAQMADAMAYIEESTSGAAASEDFQNLLLQYNPSLFTIWQQENLEFGREEVVRWFELLRTSKEKDTAILTIFVS